MGIPRESCKSRNIEKKICYEPVTTDSKEEGDDSFYLSILKRLEKEASPTRWHFSFRTKLWRI